MKLHSMIDRKVSKTYHVVDDSNKKLTEFSSALDAEKAIELVEIVSVDQKDVKKLWEQIEFEVKDLEKVRDYNSGKMDEQYRFTPTPVPPDYNFAKGAYHVASSQLTRLKTIRDMMFKIYFGDFEAETVWYGTWIGFLDTSGWRCFCGGAQHQSVDICTVCKYKRPARQR